MSLRTMGLGSIAHATPDVHEISYWLKVIRVDADRDTAQMVENKPLWYRTLNVLICDPVSFLLPDCSVESIPRSEP
jgi:hypothetical protein